MNRRANSTSVRPLIERYNGRGLLYAFVYRTAQRRILAELRRRVHSEVSIEANSMDVASSHSDEQEMDDVKSALSAVLASLTDRERVVLRMTCDGCSNQEIAERISAPGAPPIHIGRISHIRNGVVTKIRDGLGALAESMPNASTLISDLLDGMPTQEAMS
jgi:RNA polymerase sigma factor (sigma-70 family)